MPVRNEGTNSNVSFTKVKSLMTDGKALCMDKLCVTLDNRRQRWVDHSCHWEGTKSTLTRTTAHPQSDSSHWSSHSTLLCLIQRQSFWGWTSIIATWRLQWSDRHFQNEVEQLPWQWYWTLWIERQSRQQWFCVYEVWQRNIRGSHTGIIAQKLLEEQPEGHAYCQIKTTSGLWIHSMQPLRFALIVDDCGVKYVGKEQANHVIGVLEQHSKVTKDCQGER